MRGSIVDAWTTLLAIAVLAATTTTTTSVDAFALAHTPNTKASRDRNTMTRTVVATSERFHFAAKEHSRPTAVFTEIAILGTRLWERMDTLSAVQLAESESYSAKRTNMTNQPQKPVAILSSIGFFGHSGLLVLSTIFVTAVKHNLFPTSANAPPKPAGIMNDCPWPFIFFHEPKRGLKQTPTWVVVMWIALWRLTKFLSAAKVA